MTASFTLTHAFSAPPALVWRCLSEPELLARWYGPGVETIIHGFDLRPDGEWRNEMRTPRGSHFALSVFQTVTPARRLSWIESAADGNWRPIANPMMPDWPRNMFTTLDLAATETGTEATLTWTPHDATEAETATFEAAKHNLARGWGSGFGIIDQILDELQA